MTTQRWLNSATLFIALGTTALSGCSSRAGWDYSGAEVQERPAGNVLTAAQIERYPSNWTVEQIMVQALPGLQLRSGSQGPYVVVRGLSASGGQSRALVIVDGVPRPDFSPSIGLSPVDVERVEVLKDAASTALYGFRGSAGVILVQSK
jgi:TonB-dependent SusC/RagA subfamily outer membrane receptor